MLCFVYFPEHGLFGVSIPMLLEQDQKRAPGVKVPLFFQAVSNLVNVIQEQNIELFDHFLPVHKEHT